MKTPRAAGKAAKPRGRRKQRRLADPSALPGAKETWRILDDLPVAVVVATLDENPRLLFINKQFVNTFGYTLDEVPTQEAWARLAYPDAGYRTKVFARWNAAVARSASIQGNVESMEFRVAAKDGRTLDILFSAIVLGQTIQVTLSDLTARRDAERRLLSAQEELQRTAYEVTENIPAGTYTMVLKPGDAMARFTFMSSRFLDICGLDRQAAEENPFNAFACVHPDDYDEWVRKNAECFEKKVPFSEECRIVVRGETRWILAESVPRDLSNGSIVWEGVLTDITRRKQAEGELAALREKEKGKERSDREKLEAKLRASIAAAATAHEINQPLSRILLTSQLVMDHGNMAAGTGTGISGFARSLAEDARLVVRTIDKMKSLMRNTGTAKETIDLCELVDSAVLYAGSFARAAKARIHFERPSCGAFIEADADQIQIALNNLLRNAIEAVSELPARRRRDIRVEVCSDRDAIAMVVGDTGRGFAEQVAADQLPESTKPGGTGLGLFIVRTAAENHGAGLELARSPLGGAEVRVVFRQIKPKSVGRRKRAPKD